MNGSPSRPASQNPAQPDFWEQRYRGGIMPCDAGGVPQTLQDFAALHRAHRCAVTIGACVRSAGDGIVPIPNPD